jgi:hypothetical protein
MLAEVTGLNKEVSEKKRKDTTNDEKDFTPCKLASSCTDRNASPVSGITEAYSQ